MGSPSLDWQSSISGGRVKTMALPLKRTVSLKKKDI
jgi:hypothetical protein